MGISKAMMEKVAIAQGRALGANAKTTILLYSLWQRDGFSRLSDSLWVEQMMDGKSITITGSEYDSLYDDAG